MKPEILARIYFYESDRGGLHGPVTRTYIACPMEIDRAAHDCRVYLEAGEPVLPGQTVMLPIQFLSPKSVLPKLFVGRKFFLWSGGHFAEGEVVEILQGQSE